MSGRSRLPSRKAPPERVAHWAGLRPADGRPRRRPERLPSLDPVPMQPGSRRRRVARRAGLGVAGALGIGLTALAAQKIGIDNVVESIVRSNLTLVLLACGLMALSLFVRAAAWYWIVRAALPNRPCPPPRRHLGDDDRRADVGDLARAPRRACARRLACPPHRPDAGDVPGPARDAGLPDDAQSPRLGLARRGHRLDHAALSLQHAGALRLQPGAAAAARRRAVRTGADAPQRQRPPGSARRGAARGAGPGAGGARDLPRAASRHRRLGRPAWRLGDPAFGLLGAALRPRPQRPGGDRRRRRGALRRQRHSGRAGDPGEHRRLPARRDQRPAHRASESAPPMPSPTASSSRRSRSPPRSPSAFPPLSARA